MKARPDLHFVEGLGLAEIDSAAPIVVGRGHPTDLAAQITIERGGDWRRQNGLTVRTASEAWPKGADK
ncbi:hypothetical protein [Ciceribacter ferrooxidans]|uniref:Uncharacterized protein n=1 Tax=Ciceribacter ferrooxidans TaxID=2509717 RepID=A0A4Q2SZV8_9HYPH|nr:hypothetical protein [Ciceribacter ferrooxidans]RYC10150.1 hypothetical protein EUU22_18975 [Ciceribacter ferrooxidans]